MLNLRAASHLSNLAFFHSLRSFQKCSIFASLRAARTSHVSFHSLRSFQKMLDLRLDITSSTNSEFLKQRSLLVPLHL